MTKKYQPSNGTEGHMFMDHFCARCIHHPISEEADNQCPIIFRTMIYDVDDPKYPEQWQYIDGRPTCTKFLSREEHNANRREKRKEKGIIAKDTKTLDMFGCI